MAKINKIMLLALVLLLIPVSFASTLKITPITDAISPYDTAKFIITLTGNNLSDKYVLSYSDLDWTVQTDPLTDYTTGLFVEPGKDYSTTLLAKPLVETEKVFKKHSLEIRLKSEKTGEDLSAIVNIDVRRDLINYPLNINASLIMPEELFPLKANSAKIMLKNSNLLNITGLNITLKSELFEKSASIDLGPKSEKVVDFSITLDKVPPQKGTATLTIMRGNETISTMSRPYSVAAYGKFSSTESVVKQLLSEEKTVTFSNNGNSDQTEQILIDAGEGWKRLFSSTNPEASVTKINNVAYYSKELKLGPNQSQSIVVRTDYAPIVYAVIIILVICILYFAFRNPVIIAKEVSEIAVEEGGITKLNVLIKLKNRSGREVKQVKIIERVPSIGKVQIKESETLRPTKTYGYEDGMVMEYHLGKLEPGEIRFISYHLKTKLAVVGGIRLKPVIVQYENGKKSYSNAVDAYTP